jgi:hypothetical protein
MKGSLPDLSLQVPLFGAKNWPEPSFFTTGNNGRMAQLEQSTSAIPVTASSPVSCKFCEFGKTAILFFFSLSTSLPLSFASFSHPFFFFISFVLLHITFPITIFLHNRRLEKTKQRGAS